MPRPTICLYCDGNGNSDAEGTCGFCVGGIPSDTQDDWDNSWGKIEDWRKPFTVDYIFVCPQRHDFGPHRVKWNSGEPTCLTCDIPAIAVTTPTLVRREEDGE